MRADDEARTLMGAAVRFTLLGLALYGALFAAAETLVYAHTRHNRFFAVKTAPRAAYDHVILGASHAAVLDYRDLNARLEQMTGSTILNLSLPGSGVVVNRLLLDYFLVGRSAANVVYVLDSFVFYSREWNEERLADASLFNRAPFDPALARLLLRSPADVSVCLDYLTGFSKINNPGRFEPDIRADEGGRFERTYRPVAQIDEQRIAYLYPPAIDAERIALRDRYLAELRGLVDVAASRGIRVLIVRPPLPDRFRRLLPGEAAFDAALARSLEGSGAEIVDFSQAGNDEKFFFDTDHLNLAGAMNFFEQHLAPALTRSGLP